MLASGPLVVDAAFAGLTHSFLRSWTWADVVAKKAGFNNLDYAGADDEVHILKAIRALASDGVNLTLVDSKGRTLLYTISMYYVYSWKRVILEIFYHSSGVNLSCVHDVSWIPLVLLLQVTHESKWVKIAEEYVFKGGALDNFDRTGGCKHVLDSLSMLNTVHSANAIKGVCEVLLPYMQALPFGKASPALTSKNPAIVAAVQTLQRWSPFRSGWIGAVVSAGVHMYDDTVCTPKPPKRVHYE